MIRRPLALCFLLVAAGCSSLARHPRNESGDPDVRLDDCLDDLARARAMGEHRQVIDHEEEVFLDPTHLRNEVERLALEFPSHARTQAVAAQLAYFAGESDKAEFYVDRALTLDPFDAESASLRARLLAQLGNLAAARAGIRAAIERRPDDAGLRETEAAIEFAAADFVAAARALDDAERLGAPQFRIDYHRGLLAERRGEIEVARTHYRDVIAKQPEHVEAARRLKGLGSSP